MLIFHDFPIRSTSDRNPCLTFSSPVCRPAGGEPEDQQVPVHGPGGDVPRDSEARPGPSDDDQGTLRHPQPSEVRNYYPS